MLTRMVDIGTIVPGNEVYIGKVCKIIKVFLNNFELSAEE